MRLVVWSLISCKTLYSTFLTKIQKIQQIITIIKLFQVLDNKDYICSDVLHELNLKEQKLIKKNDGKSLLG